MEVDKATDLIYASFRLRLQAAATGRASDYYLVAVPPCRHRSSLPLWLQLCLAGHRLSSKPASLLPVHVAPPVRVSLKHQVPPCCARLLLQVAADRTALTS